MGLVQFLANFGRRAASASGRWNYSRTLGQRKLARIVDRLEREGLLVSDAPTLTDPVSQMCTAKQFDEPQYEQWCKAMGTGKHLHRKQWEFVFILESLHHRGVLKENARGLGFGVGREPLPAVFASLGCTITATDLEIEDQRARAWRNTQQHGALENLIHNHICPEARFRELVSFRPADMTAIADDLRDFDFTWSSCAFEHLGSIAAGLNFVEASLACLKPGGVAVHTTEFNLISDNQTMDHAATVIFRRRDFQSLALRLHDQGHEVAPLNFEPGDEPLDRHIDVPPYSSNQHLKLALGKYVSSSFGIVVKKAG
ncbi:MAG: hypothetical protein AB7G25_03070 [Sphingomonadaceae bacterium]